MAKKKATKPSKPPSPPGTNVPAARKRKSPAITRDVGVQSKGQRLQRLRAVLLLIKSAEGYPETTSYAAVEFQGDVFLSSADPTKSTQYVEENKNYDPNIHFTLNSHEILNSLVAFCDCWISKDLSKHIRFGFYTPNVWGSESNTDKTKSLFIEWPDKPMLELFASGLYSHPKFLEAAKRSIIGEYERQATCHSSVPNDAAFHSPLSHLAMIKGWDDEQWLAFFTQIEWRFGKDDANTIWQTVVDAIQRCPLFNEQLSGKEGQIISVLTDLIDKRQALPDPTQRVLHVAEVLLAFKNVETGKVNLPDPLWEMWETLPPPTDTRNLASKVIAVCPNVNKDRLTAWSRKAAQSMMEQRAHPDDKQVLSVKYRVYEACEAKLLQLRELAQSTQVDEAKLTTMMESLLAVASEHFAECSKQYHYTLHGTPTVQAIVFELFDSCFISFDGGR